jgi:hypothetical protein
MVGEIAEQQQTFDAAAWQRQQYTLQRIRTDFGFENYFRSLHQAFDADSPRDITCGDERILGPRVTVPGCGILQSEAELHATAAAIRASGLRLGSLRRHRQCGAEQLSGLTEKDIAERTGRIAEVFGVPLGAPCEMLPGIQPGVGKIARAAVVAGNPRVNPCAFVGLTPFFCSAFSATLADDVAAYANLAFAAMPSRFTAHDPFVIAIAGKRNDTQYSVKELRSVVAAQPCIADRLRAQTLAIAGADF